MRDARPSRLAGIAAISLGCCGAFAQTAPERVEITGQRAQGTALAQPSTAGSRLGLTPLDTAASVSVLDGERVRELGLSSLIDAKTLAPGISSASNPGNGGNLLSARGFSGQNSVKQLYRGP
jgi:iron complex outermembrane receptor protein